MQAASELRAPQTQANSFCSNLPILFAEAVSEFVNRLTEYKKEFFENISNIDLDSRYRENEKTEELQNIKIFKNYLWPSCPPSQMSILLLATGNGLGTVSLCKKLKKLKICNKVDVISCVGYRGGSMSRATMNFLKKNNITKSDGYRITLIPRLCTNLKVRKKSDNQNDLSSPPDKRPIWDLPCRASALVIDTDLLDEGLLGRRLLPCFRYAKKKLLTNDVLVTPNKFTVYAVPVSIHTGYILDIDANDLDSVRWSPFYEHVNIFDIKDSKIMSNPQETFHFNMNIDIKDIDNEIPITDSIKLRWLANQDGVINGFGFWWSMDMFGDGTNIISNGPTNNETAKQVKRLSQACQWIQNVTVKKNDIIDVSITRSETRIYFDIIKPVIKNIYSGVIPRWHYSGFDEILLTGYKNALKSAIEKKLTIENQSEIEIININSGSGIIAILAATCLSDTSEMKKVVHVTGCEKSANLIKIAEKITKKNESLIMSRGGWMPRRGDSGKKKLALSWRNKDFRQMTEDDLLKRGDICVTNSIDYGLIGEGLLHQIVYTYTNLLTKNNIKIIPKSARLYAMPIDLHGSYRYIKSTTTNDNETDNIDISTWREYLVTDETEYFGIDLDITDHTAISSHQEIFNFEFDDPKKLLLICNQSLNFNFTVEEDGVIEAIAFWFEIDLDEENSFTTAPKNVKSTINTVKKTTNWIQACQYMKRVTVKKNETVIITAKHDTTSVSFEINPQEKQLIDLVNRTLDKHICDPQWLMEWESFSGVQKRVWEVMQSPQGCKQAYDTVIELAIDPGRVTTHWLDPEVTSHTALFFHL
eukprot:GHVL01040966.1.p1 GENE.GHVL01040966.1~~GHVL01040966.1.p1  ORF type:complete len:815 (-),score=246.52 GHVL01040966.1:48-2492(-)